VLYEMLAGEPPYTGPSAQAIIAKRFKDPVPRLSTVRDVPPSIEEAIMQALARSPADRFASAGDFVRTLRQTEPSLPLETAKPGSRRLVGWVATALVVLAAVGWWITRTPPPIALDSDLIAVAPFDVLGSNLDLWREGMVDVLARNLDGAGALRTVPPSAVIRGWKGRADPPSAEALAHRTGARLAVFGQLFATGVDSVRIRATMYDVGVSRSLGEVEVRGASSSMDRLADSLTLGLLQQLGRSRPVGAVRATAFRSTSLPALKAFLQGEQFFRRTEWDSALAAYGQAVAADSGLALAWRRMGEVLGWSVIAGDSLGDVYSMRAAGLNHGLAPRESLLVVSESLFSVLFNAGEDINYRTDRARLFSTLQLAARSYPEDPEIWYELGDARFHFVVPGRSSIEDQLQPFDRAIALDSALAESYIHPIGLALRLNEAELARRYLLGYLAHTGKSDATSAYRLVAGAVLAALDSGGSAPPRFEAIPRHQLFQLYVATVYWPDSGETAVRAMRAMKDAPISGVSLFDNSRTPSNLLSSALAARGQLREAYQVRAGASLSRMMSAAPLGRVPDLVADSTFGSWLKDPPLMEAPNAVPNGFNTELFTSLPWWAAKRDTTSLARFAAKMGVEETRVRSDLLPWLRYGRAAAEAYLSLAKGDTATATDRFAALPDTVCACPYDQIVGAQLLLVRGRNEEAVGVFQGQRPPWTHPAEGLWRLTRARAFEATGERDKALVDYGYVADLWRRADPELQGYVAEAKEGIARLTKEPRP
jgi:eukaryotic-like serine/threonine-protein kinase